MIALLLAAGLCPSVKDIAHSAPAAFERVRGPKRVDEGRIVAWTEPVKVPGADRCRVIESKEGDPPFYVCEMQAGDCAQAGKSFEQAAKELSSCIGEAKLSDDGKRRTARYHPWAIPIRLALTRGGACSLRLFIEPLK